MASKLASFLHTESSSVPLQFCSGAKIPVRPTSTARRKQPGITHGAKRLLAGRPATGEKKAVAKRRHQLADNVAANVANAKSHGAVH